MRTALNDRKRSVSRCVRWAVPVLRGPMQKILAEISRVPQSLHTWAETFSSSASAAYSFWGKTGKSKICVRPEVGRGYILSVEWFAMRSSRTGIWTSTSLEPALIRLSAADEMQEFWEATKALLHLALANPLLLSLLPAVYCDAGNSLSGTCPICE
jgi:hypothetical protein